MQSWHMVKQVESCETPLASGLPKLGAVVTSFGYSDWSSTSVAREIKSQDIRIRKEGPDVIVESRLPGETEWSQVLFHAHPLNHGL